MFVDAATVPDGSQLDGDLCIVGAGAAGITIARHLSSGPLRVVLLESGRFETDPATQSLYDGSAEGVGYFPLGDPDTRTRVFGGSTDRWSGICRPLDPIDFEHRPWVPMSGWPFTREHLAPYYAEARSLCEVGPTDPEPDGLTSLRGGRVVPFTYGIGPPTRFGHAYRDDIRRSRSVTAYLGANVVGLEADPPRIVQRARVACLGGTSFVVRARAFVLATGGIENARLLLLSGLGNEHDQVGRWFMEHVYVDDAATLDVRHGSVGDLYTAGRRIDGHLVRGALALSAGAQQTEGLTNVAAVIEPGGAVRSRLFRRRERFPVKHVMEQVPNRDSRVVLGSERDPLGCRRVVLRWRLSALDRHTAGRAHRVLDEELRRAGIGRVVHSVFDGGDGWPPAVRGARHHMGTTRMDPDPRRGVVDGDGLVHGITNLWVAGSSVFPTCGSANPTLTIVALALRLAGHVRAVAS